MIEYIPDTCKCVFIFAGYSGPVGSQEFFGLQNITLCSVHSNLSSLSLAEQLDQIYEKENRQKNKVIDDFASSVKANVNDISWVFDNSRNLIIGLPVGNTYNAQAEESKLRAKFGNKIKVI